MADKNHVAGPELDALMAEKVMEWECLEGEALLERMYPAAGKARKNVEFMTERAHLKRIWVVPGTDERKACEECGTLPPWSTNIAHAFEVVESMSCSTKETWQFFYCSTGATVEFDYEGGRDRHWKPGVYKSDADTLPHAICLVALKAVEEKEKE